MLCSHLLSSYVLCSHMLSSRERLSAVVHQYALWNVFTVQSIRMNPILCCCCCCPPVLYHCHPIAGFSLSLSPLIVFHLLILPKYFNCQVLKFFFSLFFFLNFTSFKTFWFSSISLEFVPVFCIPTWVSVLFSISLAATPYSLNVGYTHHLYSSALVSVLNVWM